MHEGHGMDPGPSPRVSGYEPSGMTDVATLEHQLNQLILAGRSLEAFEQFYADDIVMQENTDPPVSGKERNRAREQAFFGALAEVGVTLLGSAVRGEVAYSEWIFELLFKDGRKVALTEVSARRWRSGQVVHERFYYNPNG